MHPEAYAEMHAIEENHWWFKARREILKNQITLLNLKKNSHILEIGCGTGGNLKMLSTFGSVTAVEMNDLARQLAINSNPSIKTIYPGSLPSDIPFINTKFDLICLFDVLEHIREDQESLIKLSDFLKPNGKIILTVPAYQWLWSSHDEFHHHHRRYTKKEIKKLLATSKLHSIKISYFNSLLFPIAALVRIFQKLKLSSTSRHEKIPATYINYILRAIFSLERILLKRTALPFGLSLLAVVVANNTD